MANAFDRGEVVRIDATFTDTTGAFVDPTAVTCSVVDSSGTVVSSPATSKDSVGHYHANVDTTAFVSSATYYYKLAGTSPNQGVKEGQFTINVSHFG